jgi:trans-2,3-dihydro-3-hydroxyanthranilate isomerase
METLPVRLYAAFAADETGGSMAAAVLEETPLWPAARQRIAADLNAPVTAFARPLSGNRFQVKFHSAEAEIDSPGSAVLAVFAALKDTGRIGSGAFVLETPAGEVAAEVAPEGSVSLARAPAVAGSDVPGSAQVGERFGLKVSTISRVSCAVADRRQLQVELSDPDVLANLRPDRVTAERSCADSQCGEVAFWCPAYVGLGKMEVRLRVFAVSPETGWTEQAASVGASASLACTLMRSRKLVSSAAGQAVLIVRQGAEMGRPSLLRAVVTGSPHAIAAVSVGGFSALRMHGEVVI